MKFFLRVFLLTVLAAALVFASVPIILPALASISIAGFSIATIAGAGFIAQVAVAALLTALPISIFVTSVHLI